MDTPQTIAGRYVLDRRIGAGSAAEVFEVTDRETGDKRALKILRPRGSEDPSGLVRAFHREFRLLTDLRHPHLVGVHDFGAERIEDGRRELPWFTMDLIPGRPIADALPAPPGAQRVARIADAILDALAALHARGLVHRDVTVANILVGQDVDGEPPPAWLMDLGLADRVGDVEGGLVRGTLATIAPESLRGGRLDGRADLYSLGCVLYRVLTGQDPFTAEDPWALLRAHLGTPPTPPRQLDPEIPSSLDAFVMRLLSKSPEDRPATATEARHQLAALSGRNVAGVAAVPSRPLAPSFSGRERELALFDASVAELERDQGAIFIVQGRPGVGRSRLLAELRLRTRLAGRRVALVGAGQAPRRPFGWLDRIITALRAESGGAGEHAPAESGAAARIEQLARELGAEPCVLLIDDAERIDRGSAEALSRLAARIEEQELPCVLVLAPAVSDTEDTSTASSLADALLERGGARAIRLHPLDADGVSRMAGSMLGRGELPPRWAEAVRAETGGLPLLVEALIERLVDAGQLAPGAALPEDPAPLLEGLEVRSRRSEAFLDAVWARLDGRARELLAAVAIGDGEPLGFDTLAALDPRTVVSAESADALIESGLVEPIWDERRQVALRLTAPGMATAILERSDPELTATLHRRRADQLEGEPGRRASQARHLRAAGLLGKAGGMLLESAREALAQGLPHDARELCDEALSLGDPLEAAGAGTARRLRAEALVQLARPDEAAREYARAIDQCRRVEAHQELAAALRGAAELRRDAGDPEGALEQLEEALALSDDIGDTAGGAAALTGIGRTLARVGRAEEAEQRLSAGLRQARRSSNGGLEVELLVLLGDLDLAAGRTEQALERFREAEAAAAGRTDRAPRDAARRGRVRALEADGRLVDALAEADGLLADSRTARSVEGESEALALRGTLLARLGRRSEALATVGSAVKAARRLGRARLWSSLLAEEARLLGERGQLRTAAERLERGRRALEAEAGAGELSSVLEAEAGLAAALGQEDRARDLADRIGWEAEGPAPSRARRALLLGEAALHAGRPDAARERLQEGCFHARRAGLISLEMRGLLALSEAYLELREAERARLALRKVRDLAERRGEEEPLAGARLLSAELELADPGGDMKAARDEAELAAATFGERERGDIAWRAWLALHQAAARAGDETRASEARGHAVQGVEAFLAGLPDGARRTWQRRGRVRAALELSQQGGGPRAAAGPAAEGAADPAAARRADALERLLEINRALNSTLELGRLLQTLVDTAVDLVGAERGFVLLSEEGRTEIEIARGEGGTELAGEDRAFSRMVARRVAREGEPLLSRDARSDERLSESASIHALSIRSILAQPLRSRGKVAGALVLDSRRASSLFDQEDQSLVERLADQAGIAVTNARMVDELRAQSEEIRRLNEKLTEQVEEQRVEILEKQSNLEVRYRYDCMVGASGPMQRVYRAIDKILPTDIPVLVTGESGTGKDLVARVLHYNGQRSRQRFVTLNCAALTETLLESELFGHRKGSFSGADRDRKGLFEQAAGGTIFLDEIGEMPLQLQPKLLRALQFGEIRRVGDDTPRQVDVRVIAATNQDVSAMVASGRFREDLFYRLDVARVHMAPLRERMEDIGLLVNHFLEAQAEKGGVPQKTIEPPALRLFLRYDWPGNVRELENEVTKLAAFTQSDVITEVDVLENAVFLERARQQRPGMAAAAGEPAPPANGSSSVSTLEQTELDQIRQALRAAGGNRTKAAEMLGIDRSTLYRKIKRLGDDFEDL
jgi:transcriptional regulator with GAF, ATPase, and Fis domain